MLQMRHNRLTESEQRFHRCKGDMVELWCCRVFDHRLTVVLLSFDGREEKALSVHEAGVSTYERALSSQILSKDDE